jgi:ribosomal protein S18 acetylase RimI-like enzyme
MPEISLVPLSVSDKPFLWEMLFLALYAPPGQPAFTRDILGEPDIACYVDGWGTPGDWGLMAWDGGKPAGAIWLRQWLGDHKGYGYVSEEIPEMSIALLPEYRNQGLGRRMIETVIGMAKERFTGLSLSVVGSSPAHRLYERLGFRKVGQILDSPIMLLEWGKNG